MRSRPETTKPSDSPTHVSILLVEDNPADVGLIRMAMEEARIEGELIVAIDGEIAISFIDEIDAQPMLCPDLAIIDLNLPRKPGSEVLARLKGSTKCGNIAIVILSSSEAAQDRTDAARLGARRYLRKPTRLDDFLKLGLVFKEMLEHIVN